MFEFKAKMGELAARVSSEEFIHGPARVYSCERSGALVEGQPHPLEKDTG